MKRLIWLFGGVVAIESAALLVALVGDPRQPVSAPEIVPLRASVVEGEVLPLRAYREKVRDDCVLESRRFATNLATGLEEEVPAKAWRGGETESDFVDLAFDVSALPAGDYTGRTAATYYCPRGRTFLINSNVFEFTIQPRG